MDKKKQADYRQSEKLQITKQKDVQDDFQRQRKHYQY